MREREPKKEVIRKGELFFLTHPETINTFSGYGLTVQEDSKGKLDGLLMVDRPRAADPGWLQEVEQTYGQYQLVPMTATGERGIACRMQIEPESQDYLQRTPGAQSAEIAAALEPLLEEPPRPIFNMWWDEDVRAWRSLMSAQMELPAEIREVFENTGYGCLTAETNRGAMHICHAHDKDIQGFPNQPVIYRWQLVRTLNA